MTTERILGLLDTTLARLPDTEDLSRKSIKELLHEIGTYHEELRYQNEELRRIQGDLEREKNRYATLFHSAPAGYLVLDRDMLIVESNETFRAMTQLDGSMLRGHRFSEFVAAEDQDQLYFFSRNIVVPGNKSECSLNLVTGYGEKLPVRIAGTLDKKEDTRNTILVAIMDMTERKQAEDTINRINASLEKRIEERTAALTATNRELEAFAYSVSHDLRTPLRAINGFSHILLDRYNTVLDTEGLRTATVIRDSAARMGKLIDDLLAFSRLGRTEMRIVPIDMKAMATDVFVELHHNEPKAGHAAEIEFTISDIPPSMGDPAMIRQVWVNLLSNAIKFTAKREKALIEIGWQAEENSFAYTVRDNGAGFDMQYAGKLFGVFQRLHGVKEFEGTGVGLALVQRILTRHGGSIRAQARLDRGATFIFTIGVPKDGDGTMQPLP